MESTPWLALRAAHPWIVALLDVRAHDPQAAHPDALRVALDYLLTHPPTPDDAVVMELARSSPGGPLPAEVEARLAALASITTAKCSGAPKGRRRAAAGHPRRPRRRGRGGAGGR